MTTTFFAAFAGGVVGSIAGIFLPIVFLTFLEMQKTRKLAEGMKEIHEKALQAEIHLKDSQPGEPDEYKPGSFTDLLQAMEREARETE